MFDKDASFALVSQFVKNDDTLDRMQKVGEECLAGEYSYINIIAIIKCSLPPIYIF